MKAETLEALKSSIAHWERVVINLTLGNEPESVGYDTCDLCKRFTCGVCECAGEWCPVRIKMQTAQCRNTPYVKYFSDRTTDNAQKELDFLKSLLPVERICSNCIYFNGMEIVCKNPVNTYFAISEWAVDCDEYPPRPKKEEGKMDAKKAHELAEGIESCGDKEAIKKTVHGIIEALTGEKAEQKFDPTRVILFVHSSKGVHILYKGSNYIAEITEKGLRRMTGFDGIGSGIATDHETKIKDI